MLLLVSVVTADEVEDAVAGGADILDVKNPAEGSLGAPSLDVIRRVRETAPAAVPVSVAIGDMPDLPGLAGLAAAGAASCGVEYVKAGLMGSATPETALALLSAVCRATRATRPGTKVMAAGYADAARVGALPVSALVAAASAAGADGCMIDTAVKDGSSLFDILDDEELRSFAAACRGAGLLCALAGSLRAADLPRVAALGADIAGVRGAACRGDRLNGRVDAEAVRLLKGLSAAAR